FSGKHSLGQEESDVMKLGKLAGIFRRSFEEWNKDKAYQLGAALAYYSIFSLAPLLLIAVAIAGLFYEEEAARTGIITEVGTTFGEAAGRALADLVRTTQQTGHGVIATGVAFALLFFGASGVFVQLQDALNAIWKVQPRPDRGWWDMIRDRFLSFALV